MDFDARASAVLHTAVELYIVEAQPVSSAAVAKRLRGHKVSPATARAVMADLERIGLLYQPHTSAGRVPTELGLRLYVDNLVNPKLRPRDRSQLEATAASSGPDTFPTTLGRRLAGLSGQVALVAVPRFLATPIKEVGLARCDARRFLAFFVSPGGLVQQKVVEVDFDLRPELLTSAQNFLSDKLRDHTVTEVRALIRTELEEQRTTADCLHREALEIGARALPEPCCGDDLEIYVEGTSHLVGQPDFADVERLRELLETIEERATLLKLLERVLDSSGVRVMLGSDHHLAEVPELACVGGSWQGPSGNTAVVSLLGPARMDYGRLVPMVSFATQLLGRYWELI
jgi:heat-inducible transcriptional repressor